MTYPEFIFFFNTGTSLYSLYYSVFSQAGKYISEIQQVKVGSYFGFIHSFEICDK